MDPVRQAIESHWKRVFNFAFRMTLDRDVARAAVDEVFFRAFLGADKIPAEPRTESWLLRIASVVLDGKYDASPEVSFNLLDEKLRSEPTRTDVVRSLTRPQQNFYLWELKQGCMTSVVNCLPPGERLAFVLNAVLGYTEEDGANILGISTSAFKVRLSRARKKVTDYLAPRCEHVDPQNPCRCPSRLGVALTGGFLPRIPGSQVNLRRDFGRYGSSADGEDAPLRDVIAIYHSLPEPDPPQDLVVELLGKLDSGTWATLRDDASKPQ